MNTATAISTRVCVVGGGPAGVMLGFLLARAGIEVTVLEKHKDFFRDFRGDTIHPSTLELMHELGLLQEFLARPHQEMREIQAHFGQQSIHIADFTHLPTQCKFIAFMPQWEFLNFLAGHARNFPSFQLRMETEVTGLLFDNGRVTGVSARTPEGELMVQADLVVGADGRASTVRQSAGLEIIDYGAPIDVLWFRLTKQAGDPPAAFGFVAAGQFMILIDRGDYWQCAYVIQKGSFDAIKANGLEAFRQKLILCAPFLAARTAELKSWDDVKFLNVKVDHLRQWHREGLLCIGDSAHAMSPVGGVGINLAVQDAVATANILIPRLHAGGVTEDDLRSVQRRRARPAHMTQRVQILMHEHFLAKIFESKESLPPPWPMKMLEKFPKLRGYLAEMIGLGFRPEHIRT